MYKELSNEIFANIKSEKGDTAGIVLEAAKHTSFTKAMKSFVNNKKPEMEKGSAAALFKEAVTSMVYPSLKQKVSEPRNQSQRGI